VIRPGLFSIAKSRSLTCCFMQSQKIFLRSLRNRLYIRAAYCGSLDLPRTIYRPHPTPKTYFFCGDVPNSLEQFSPALLFTGGNKLWFARKNARNYVLSEGNKQGVTFLKIVVDYTICSGRLLFAPNKWGYRRRCGATIAGRGGWDRSFFPTWK